MKKLLVLLTWLMVLPMAVLAQGSTSGSGTLLRNGDRVSTKFEPATGEHWYRIEIPEDGTIELSKTGSVWARLYDSGDFGSSRASIRAKDSKQSVANAGKGTYYVKVERDGGPQWNEESYYTLKYVFTPSSYANDPEPNDTYKEARTLYSGQTVQGHLGFKNEGRDTYDWYKIDITDPRIVTFDITTQASLKIYNMELYYLKDGELYRDKVIWPGSDQDQVLSSGPQYLDKGTFYVKLSSTSSTYTYGGYSLHYEANLPTQDLEPNDDYTNAEEIKDSETKEGNMGFIRDDGTYDKEDWYVLELDEDSQLSLSFVTREEASLQVKLSLYTLENEELKRVVWSTAQQSTAFETPSALPAGTYYLQILHTAGRGPYAVTLGMPKRAAGSQIRVTFSGRKQVRLSTPADYTIRIKNISNEVTQPCILAIPATEDIELIGAKLPGLYGTTYMTLDEITYEGADIMWFFVPSMNPHQEYSFTLVAKGKVNASGGTRGIIATMVIASALGVAFDIAEDQLNNWMVSVIRENVDLDLEETDNSAHLVGNALYKTIAEESQKSGILVQAAKPTIKKMCTTVIETLPGGKIVTAIGDAVEVMKSLSGALRRRLWYWIYKDLGYIKESHPAVLDVKEGCNSIVRSWDPNEMCGPVGSGEENYIAETSSVEYRILFENKAEATDNAYRIRITNELDPDVFDVSTVRFGSTSHDGVEYDWKMSQEGNTLSWDIEGIELPPNVNAPEGEGYVTFSVNLKPGLANKAQIKNKATIIFDYNEPIETNEYVNTLDLTEPSATMISALEKDGVVTVTCSGTDGESGVNYYMYFASHNKGEYQFIGDSPSPEFEFTLPEGTKADEYSFYALAVDNVGNTQQTPSAAIIGGKSNLGDANGDGIVNTADIVEVVNYIKGTPSAIFIKAAADMDGNGEVDAKDLGLIVNIIMSK